MAEDEIEPDRFDVIVIGTGLPESILAAAAASSGRRVLHLDSEHFYGSEWASFSLDQLVHFENSLGACNGTFLENQSGVSTEISLFRDEFLHGNGEIVHECPISVLGSSREYALDISGPKMLFCAEALVDLLVKCGASNYLEFKDIHGSFVWTDSGFRSAPASKSELFQDRSLNLLEKKSLMRILKIVQTDFEQNFSEEALKISFVQFLEQQKIVEPIQSIILYVVALLDEDQKASTSPLSALEGLQILRLHLSSIGRFQNSGAFLSTLYGQGELCQAFCRVAAVHGALYVLRRQVASVLFDEGTREYKGVRTKSGQVLYSDKLILGASHNAWGRKHLSASPEKEEKRSSFVGRFICITDSSLHPAKNNLLVVFPPQSINGSNANVVRVLQLGSTAVCPDGKYVVQMSCVARDASAAKATLQEAINILFFLPGNEDATNILHRDTCKPKLLWSAFHSEKLHSTTSQFAGDRIAICAQPGAEADYRKVVESTEKMFHQLFGDEKWFSNLTAPDLETGDENLNT